MTYQANTATRLTRVLLLGTVSAFLISCGSGSSETTSIGFPVAITTNAADTTTDDDAKNETTSSPNPPIVSKPPVVNTPVVENNPPVVTNPPVVNDPPVVINPPIVNNPATDNETVTANPQPPGGDVLRSLYGNLFFAYQFTEGTSNFYINVVFDSTDVIPTESGGVLQAMAQTSFKSAGSDTPLPTADRVFNCTYISRVDGYLCVLTLGYGASDNFLLPRLVDGKSTGVYEFCTNDENTRCATELINSPDGIVALVNTSTSPAAHLAGTSIDAVKRASTLAPLVEPDYVLLSHQYDKQASHETESSAAQSSLNRSVQNNTVSSVQAGRHRVQSIR